MRSTLVRIFILVLLAGVGSAYAAGGQDKGVQDKTPKASDPSSSPAQPMAPMVASNPTPAASSSAPDTAEARALSETPTSSTASASDPGMPVSTDAAVPHAGADGSAAASSPAAASDDANGGAKQQSDVPQLKQRDPRYLLTKNDVLNIEFPFTPEYNEVVTVQPDGFINLKQLPDMHVEGMTTPEVTERLKQAYAKLLHDPVITVVLQNFLNPYFIAYGEVNNPGKFQLYGDTTVAQAIGIAGGFTSHAKHSEVYLFRRVSNEWVSSQKLDVKHMLKSGNLAEDLHLQPGDMLWVPKSGVAKLISIQPLIPWNEFRLNFGPY